MVIFQYILYIFGIHLWTVLYPKPCYNEPCYKEGEVYICFLYCYCNQLFPRNWITSLSTYDIISLKKKKNNKMMPSKGTAMKKPLENSLAILWLLLGITKTHPFKYIERGWSGGAKVSCILCHRGVQLILAYSWARPAILVAGKGWGGMFLFLLFLHFHSCSSFFPVLLFHLFDYLFYHSSPFLWETTQNDPQGLTCR